MNKFDYNSIIGPYKGLKNIILSFKYVFLNSIFGELNGETKQHIHPTLFLYDFELTRSTKKNNYSFLHDLFDLTRISKYVYNFIILRKSRFTVYFIHYVYVGAKIKYNN